MKQGDFAAFTVAGILVLLLAVVFLIGGMIG